MVPVHTEARADAQKAWTATSFALAGGARVRVSADGGRSYPRSRERQLPAAVPDQPAAVRIYDQQGEARCLPADLDIGRGGPGQVLKDLARLRGLIERCGGRVITDRSPNGGQHLYVPWRDSVPFHELRPVMIALAALLPSLDVQPAINLLSGCLRPPGSRHKSGGWQELTTPLVESQSIARDGNPPSVWVALQTLLSALEQPGQLAASTLSGATPSSTPVPRRPIGLALPAGAAGSAGPHERRAHQEHLALPKKARALTPDTLRIAQHGEYDKTRYGTPSQARQRVLAAAAGGGWHYIDLLEHLQTGRWPGLAGFYARYRPAARPERLAADWISAVTWLRVTDAQRSGPALPACAPKSHTREPATHRGGSSAGGGRTLTSVGRTGRQTSEEYQFVRTWWNVARRAERARYTGRAGFTRRLLLRAVANAAQKKGSRYLEFGCRSLSLAMGVDHSTTAAALRALRQEEDPLVVLLEDRRGVRGDLYELTLPEEYADTIDRRDWRAGKIEAIHPVFRALGLTVAFIYEELDAAASTSFDLADLAMTSLRASQKALLVLSQHGLATKTNAGWVRGAACLDQVAVQLGVPKVLEEIQAGHQKQRREWRALLGAFGAWVGSSSLVPVTRSSSSVGGGAAVGPESLFGSAPPAELETLLELLQRVLGAVPVPP